MGSIQALPGVFPLHADKNFLRESEWVILKLIIRPLDTLDQGNANELSEASGGQLSVDRCNQLISIVRISKLSGLGTWISRLLAESGWDVNQVRTLSAEEIMAQVNAQAGYPLCNDATVHALTALQKQWKGELATSVS
ncbi:MAG: hypothetical protein R8K22_05490 [Mariprofundaceae bacterium]